jgi:flagellar hook-associated protein 2
MASIQSNAPSSFGSAIMREGRLTMGQKINEFDPNESLINLKKELLKVNEPSELKIKDNKEKKLPELETIRTKAISLQSKAQELSNYLGANKSIPNIFGARTFSVVSTDNSAEIVATNESKVARADVSISVIRLATQDTLTSNSSLVIAADSQTVGQSGELWINGIKIMDVETTTTIGEVIEAINNAPESAHVKAELLKIDEGQYRLTITHTELATPISLAGTNASLRGLSGLYLPEDGDLSTADSLRAEFTYNGMTVKRNSNVVNDLITGTSINLRSVSTTGVKGRIETHFAGAFEAIQNFVVSYNDLAENVLKHRKLGDDGQPAEDASLYYSSVLLEMTSLVESAPSHVLGHNFETDLALLDQIGIRRTSEGQLEIFDQALLYSKITTQFSAVQKLFGDYATSNTSYFEARAIPKDMHTFATKDVTVTYFNDDGALKATFSAPGLVSETVEVGSSHVFTSNSEGSFAGLVIVYDGPTLGEGESQTSVLKFTKGIAANLYEGLSNATVKRNNNSEPAVSLFDRAIDEILKETESLEEKIKSVEESIDSKIQIMQKRLGVLYEASNRTTQISAMLEMLYKEK